MPTLRTSTTHPLQIATLPPLPHATSGRVALTFCPGKVQPHGATGAWSRDLGLDLDAICAWGAVAVVTLVEDYELASLQVPALGAEVAARHMEWLHLPIPDAGVPGPAFEAVWSGEVGGAGEVTGRGGVGGGVGEGLRARLRDGFSVLVHCKGGLGRAGTVAARLLVELGVAPPEAVRQVREVRPGAIETPAQLTHVMGLHAVPEPEPSTSAEAIRDRAVGCLLGLAVGDAVGTTLEFSARDTYPPLTDMVGGGPFRLRPGQWTDDTAMALALADSLAAHPDLDEADLMARFVSWHERGTYSCTGTCFDIGVTTRAALARWKKTGNPVAGSTDPRSAGNGSLMRLAPVAVRHWRDRPTLRDVAARQSRTTHAAPEAVDACVAYAELLADAIAGQRRSEVMRGRADIAGAASSALRGVDPGTGASASLAGAIAPILGGSWRGKARPAIHASGYVAHSLEAALWSVGSTGSFRAAVLRAANLGEDADTTAAVAGQFAGALCGASRIPGSWRARVAWGDRIKGMAEERRGEA